MKNVCMVLAGLVIVTMAVGLAGCPGQSTSTDQAGPDMSGPPTMPDEQAADTAPAEEDTSPDVQKPDTLGDLVQQIDMPESYEMTIEHQDQTSTHLVLLEDTQPVRMKMSTEEGTIYVNFRDKEMYVYDPGENSAMKMPISQDIKQEIDWKPDDYNTEATIAGSETVDGVDCWIFEGTVDETSLRSWVGKKDGLPRKAETDGDLLRFSYDRINQISEEEFELPADAEIVDLGNIPGASQ